MIIGTQLMEVNSITGNTFRYIVSILWTFCAIIYFGTFGTLGSRDLHQFLTSKCQMFNFLMCKNIKGSPQVKPEYCVKICAYMMIFGNFGISESWAPNHLAQVTKLKVSNLWRWNSKMTWGNAEHKVKKSWFNFLCWCI